MHMKAIWRQYEIWKVNLKLKPRKFNLTLSDTEFEGEVNQAQSETELEEAFRTRSRRARLDDTTGKLHWLIPPQQLQLHTRVWTTCRQVERQRRSRYHITDITRPRNLYLMKLQQVTSRQTWEQEPFTMITKTQWGPLNLPGWNIHILLPLTCIFFGR